MLKLSDYENDMMIGKYGPMKQKAIENICRYAKVLGVEELCKVSMATIFGGAHEYLKAAGNDDVKDNFCAMNMACKETIPLDSFSPECMTQT